MSSFLTPSEKYEIDKKYVVNTINKVMNKSVEKYSNQIETNYKPKTKEGLVPNFAQQDWQQKIYEGLVVSNTSKRVAKGNINKPNRRMQITEPMTSPTYEIASDNSRNRGLKVYSREKFSMGRHTAFMPQE